MFDIIKWAFDKVFEFFKSKKEHSRNEIHENFENVLKKQHESLAVIHKDYQKNLSELKAKIISKELPPVELIEWLRQKGLEYRANREELWSRTEETFNRIKEHNYDPNGNLQEKYLYYLKEYEKKVWEYFLITISDKELSFHRAYEQSLQTLLHSLKNKRLSDKKLAEQFYNTDFVADMNEVLVKIVDIDLSPRWKEVSITYSTIENIVYNVAT